VTELLEQNLFDFSKYIDDSTYFQNLSRLKYITKQILISLEFLHSMDIIHCDIKPENILLENVENAKVKLIDFGSSCFSNDRQSSYIQSRSYRAPEVILGLPYSGKIDIWSLGCVVAEMFTNEVTFNNHSLISMLARIEAICGTFPKYMRLGSVHGNNYFLESGLLYKKVRSDGRIHYSSFCHTANDNCANHHLINESIQSEITNSSSVATNVTSEPDESDIDNIYYEIYKPTMTTLAERLGFDFDILETNQQKHRRNYYSYFRQKSISSNSFTEEEDQVMFVDFVKTLLTIDPEHRPNASQALEHPWILSAEHLKQNVSYELDDKLK